MVRTGEPPPESPGGQDVERGVFATRAPCRPNPIGLSIVEILGREGNVLFLDALDVLDGTPLLDIKPYVGQLDCITGTRNGWLDEVDAQAIRERKARGYGDEAAAPRDSPSSRDPG